MRLALSYCFGLPLLPLDFLGRDPLLPSVHLRQAVEGHLYHAHRAVEEELAAICSEYHIHHTLEESSLFRHVPGPHRPDLTISDTEYARYWAVDVTATDTQGGHGPRRGLRCTGTGSQGTEGGRHTQSRWLRRTPSSSCLRL